MASEVRAREFTAVGIRRARKFLDEVRNDPEARREPPRELLEEPECTRTFRGKLTVDRERPVFASRREIGEYLAPKLRPFGASIADRTSLWSWLGMFHFGRTVRVVNGAAQLSPLDETFVIDPLDSQNLRGIHRHYLRSAWQLYEVHGDNAAFLLNQSPTARGFIADRVFQSQRIFNSAGVVPLILGLYTNGNRPKRGFQGRPGGLRHLLRVLDQLERTHDVYGMPPEALVRILPPEFKPWTNGAPPQGDAPDGAARNEPDTGEPSGQSGGEEGSQSDASPSESGMPVPHDPKLDEWEARVRLRGRGALRYKRFRATVSVDAATGALHGRIKSPKGRWVGEVSAENVTGFARALRRHVDEYLVRGRGASDRVSR